MLWPFRKDSRDFADRVAGLEGQVDALRSEISRLRASQAEWEVSLVGLTDKLSRQLKRMGQRQRDADGGDDLEFPELGPLSPSEFERLR